MCGLWLFVCGGIDVNRKGGKRQCRRKQQEKEGRGFSQVCKRKGLFFRPLHSSETSFQDQSVGGLVGDGEVVGHGRETEESAQSGRTVRDAWTDVGRK